MQGMREEMQGYKSEIVALKLQLDDMENDRDLVQQELDAMKGRGLEHFNMLKCEQLERALKVTLEAVELRKATLLRDELDVQKEQRLCVVCCAVERTIVLLPCRHLCLCSDCAEHDSLKDCPLCRKEIQQKFIVFS